MWFYSPFRVEIDRERSSGVVTTTIDVGRNHPEYGVLAFTRNRNCSVNVLNAFLESAKIVCDIVRPKEKLQIEI